MHCFMQKSLWSKKVNIKYIHSLFRIRFIGPILKSYNFVLQIIVVALFLLSAQATRTVDGSILEFLFLCHVNQGRSQLFVKGGAKPKNLDLFADSAQQSHANKVSPNWPGSRACLRAWKLFGFSLLNIHSAHFGGTFLYFF